LPQGPVKITDEVYQVGGPTLTHPYDAAIYLVRFDDQAALIDAGCGSEQEKLFGNILSAGVRFEQVRYLLLTHCHFDHSGGARSLKTQLQCPIVAHELDAEFLEAGNDRVTAATWYGTTIQPFQVDRKLTKAQEIIDLAGRDVTAVQIPGHSPGSVAYLVFSEDKKIVFAQDVHGPLDPDFLSDRMDYYDSLQRLLDLEADILCEGHYGIFEGKEQVSRFIRSFLRR
jgi:glyoxylase-like metal-dependent hydrolase (beta-lactamase superfamily II)